MMVNRLVCRHEKSHMCVVCRVFFYIPGLVFILLFWFLSMNFWHFMKMPLKPDAPSLFCKHFLADHQRNDHSLNINTPHVC
jgi:hypothetical protein